MTKITAIYIRVSTDEQNSGAEAQELALRNHCQAHNLNNYEVFTDIGVSGRRINRPGLDRLMDMARQGKISSVIVYSFSRFARSTRHLIDALEEFKSLGISFLSLTEAIDTSSAIGMAFFTIVSAIAQLERELIVERTKAGLQNAQAKGKILGRKPHDNVKLILELHRQKMSFRKIASLCKCSASTVCRTVAKIPA